MILALSIGPTTTTPTAHLVASSGHGTFDWWVLVVGTVAAVTGVMGVVAAWIALRRNHTVCRMRSVIVTTPVPGRRRVRVYVHIVPGGSTWQVTKLRMSLSVGGRDLPYDKPTTRVGVLPHFGTAEANAEIHMDIAETHEPITVDIRVKFKDGARAKLHETITAQ